MRAQDSSLGKLGLSENHLLNITTQLFQEDSFQDPRAPVLLPGKHDYSRIVIIQNLFITIMISFLSLST